MKNIFEKNFVGQICYSLGVEDRVRDIKKCNDIKALETARKMQGLQKTVIKAIDSRIKKLNQQTMNSITHTQGLDSQE